MEIVASSFCLSCPGQLTVHNACCFAWQACSVTCVPATKGTKAQISRHDISFVPGRPLYKLTASAGEKPRVRQIPGSVEARGTELRKALQGRAPFCRPLRHEGGSLLLTATADPLGRDRLLLSLGPHDCDDATAAVLLDTLMGPSVSISTIEVGTWKLLLR